MSALTERRNCLPAKGVVPYNLTSPRHPSLAARMAVELRRAPRALGSLSSISLRPRDHILLQLLQHVIEHPFAIQYYRRLISESHDTPNPYIITKSEIDNTRIISLLSRGDA